ncbi:hypothetical protein BGY98DRAFT_539410 [Russula aff. rugulosa BPL654]|nr:hypothetical protein BGY98DRAFT_539410 [Russula aff. rugulosa BPL654]
MASLLLTPSRYRRDEREWLCQSLGRRRLRPFRSRRHTSWQIWGLVRSPVPISERYDEGNASLPGDRVPNFKMPRSTRFPVSGVRKMAALQYCPCRDCVGINTDNTFLTTLTIMRFTRPPFGIRGGPHTVKLRIPGHLEYFTRGRGFASIRFPNGTCWIPDLDELPPEKGTNSEMQRNLKNTYVSVTLTSAQGLQILAHS